ncbi:MAG: sigma 54-interacting transcriptional regulator [Deltaproteobacteria bacterium]|nr:sigma 54-interacting transcriptional regulator [Deltaproteobacteria bacterium]
MRESEAAARAAENGRRLFLVTADGRMRYLLVDHEGIVLGSGRDVDLRIEDSTVSRRHLRLRGVTGCQPDPGGQGGGPLVVEDLGSTNGSVVGLAPLGVRPRTLSLPALLTLGRTRVAVLPGIEIPGGGVAMRLGELVSASPRVARTLFQALAAAWSPLPVLLQGESGTGKELLARVIHGAGPLSSGPLVTVNCATLSPERAEVELFGCRKGAYTGAVADRPGLLATASGGALFLDEVAELPLPVQARLLRVLEGQPFRAVGDHVPRTAQVRIMAASNADLALRVRQGLFRSDLFFRLHVLPVRMPPLRERPEDVPLLTVWLGRSLPGCRLTPEGASLLARYPWPGNVRELRSVLQRLASLGGGAPAGPDAVLGALEAGAGPAGARCASAGPVTPEPGCSTSQLLRTLGVPRSTYYYRRARQGLTPAAADGTSPRCAP